MTNKHPKSQLVTTFANPGLFESDDAITDASETYLDWPDIDDPCEKSPTAQHAFDCSPGADPEICVHCGRRC